DILESATRIPGPIRPGHRQVLTLRASSLRRRKTVPRTSPFFIAAKTDYSESQRAAASGDFVQCNIQCLCDGLERIDGAVALPCFDHADLCDGHPDLARQRGLAHAAIFAKSPD